MITLIILALAILCIDSFLTMFWCDKLGKKVKKLEDDINFLRSQTDVILSDISIVNSNIRIIYGILNEIKQNKNL